MSEYWIDIEDPYGTKSVGPIKTASFWQSTDRLDRTGEFVFEMPASDSRVDLFRALDKRYYARCYSIVGGVKTEEGAGIIEAVTYKKSSNSLVISGTDLFLELADLSVEALEVLEEETRTPDSVQYYDGTATAFKDVTSSYDGNDATGVAVPADDEDWLYVGDADPFDVVDFHLGTNRNSDPGDFKASYPPATGTWASGTIISDTTKANETDDPASPNNWGASWWAVDGQMRWERPAAWATSTVNSVADKYWLRLRYSEDMTAAANGGTIDVNEIEIIQELPTSTALSDILAYAPAWALSGSFHSKTETDVYMKFAHESVLTALIRVAERTGEHFRRGTGRLIEWLQDDETAASVRAVSNVDAVGAQDNTLICLITRFEETKDVREIATRIYPFGAGVAGARITLAQTTYTSAGDYVVNPTSNYIQSTAGVAAYGQIQRAMTWGEIGAINAAGTVDTNASNTLYLAALEYLARHKAKGRYYRLEITKLDVALKVGQVLPVQYKHYEAGFELVDVDEDLWVLEKTTRLNANGTRVVNLLVSTIDAWPEDPDDEITTGIQEIREFLAYGGPFGAGGLTPASIDALFAKLDLSRYYLKPTDTNVILGLDAGNVPPGDLDNTLIGYRAGYAATSSVEDAVAVGADAMRLAQAVGCVAIGHEALENAGKTANGDYNTMLGAYAGQDIDQGQHNVGVGTLVMWNSVTGNNNVMIGYGVMEDGDGSENVGIGYYAFRNSTTSAMYNTMVGPYAGLNITDGLGNVGIGQSAMRNITTASYNVVMGYDAGRAASAGYTTCVLIGTEAGYGLATGGSNVAVGYAALNNAVKGNGNTAIGAYAMDDGSGGASGGSYNVGLGHSAMLSGPGTGDYNIGIGMESLGWIGHGAGAHNVAVGYRALYKATTAGLNVAVGQGAGYDVTTSSLSVFLGYQAGYNETVGSRLYIEASSSASPLIYGEFDNDLVRINGTLDVTTNITMNANTYVGLNATSARLQFNKEATAELLLADLLLDTGKFVGLNASSSRLQFNANATAELLGADLLLDNGNFVGLNATSSRLQFNANGTVQFLTADLMMGTEDGGGKLNFDEATSSHMGIVWGSDANKVTLYRSADDMLKTDDSLTVAVGLNIGTATGAGVGDGFFSGRIRAHTASNNSLATFSGYKLLADNVATGIFEVSFAAGVRLQGSMVITLVLGSNAAVAYVSTSERWLAALRLNDPGNKIGSAVTLIARADAGSQDAVFADVGNATVTITNDEPNRKFTVNVQVDHTGNFAGVPTCYYMVEMTYAGTSPTPTFTAL